MSYTLHHGDCLAVLATLPDNSVDSVVTDPPYGLSFMGKKWDYDVPSEAIWRECLRVLKPGGHLLAFAGTRTQHRMAVRIEDAGFEIRDMIAWVYGSGFPKSLDVSKAIDKCNGDKDRLLKFTQWYRTAGVSRIKTTRAMVEDGHISPKGTMAGHYFASSKAGQPAIPTAAIWKTLRPLCKQVPEWVDELVARIEAEREVIGKQQGGLLAVAPGQNNDRSSTTLDITAPATDAAKQWSGWGTALKPSLESLTVATKPLDPLGHCSKMIENLTKGIESCRQNASNAEKSSRHTQAELTEARANTVLENAAIPIAANLVNGTETGRVDDISSKVDTLALAQEQEHTALSTFLSWKNTLVGVLNAMKMSTTGTAFETITDWKILSFCLSQITPDTITKAKFNPSGLNVDVLRATEYLNVSLALLQNTLALSVLAPAMSQEAESCRGVDVKPNLNPCIMARKPLIGTVAENVLEHGTGALNIDGCRVGIDPVADASQLRTMNRSQKDDANGWGMNQNGGDTPTVVSAQGRWPANLIHDGSEEVLALFPQTTSGALRPYKEQHSNSTSFRMNRDKTFTQDANSGSAARFFYCAKASKRDREEGLEGFEQRNNMRVNGPRESEEAKTANKLANHHPTVKPTDLMRYLCRLVTPPGGVVLDPFTGSGSTGKAALLEGFEFIGIEREAEYVAIAEARIRAALETKPLI
jgi:DNA modification methylase